MQFIRGKGLQCKVNIKTISFLKTKENVLTTCPIAIINIISVIYLVSTQILFVNFSFLATEKELLSVSVEKQREIDEHQKIITSLTLQLREKDKENETLKQNLQGN